MKFACLKFVEYIAALSTEVVAAYVDAASSTGTEILMNKWTVPFTGRTT